MPGNNWDQHGISAIAAWNRRAPGWRPISEEQVEAAARLIAVINNGHPDYTPQETVAAFWNLLDTDQQDRYRRMARAALSTLPPPGEAK